MDRFYRMVYSVFPVESAACGAPTDWCFSLDDCGRHVELIFKTGPGGVLDLGKAHLEKIWNQIAKWDAQAFELLRAEYKGNAEEELEFDTLMIYEQGNFALGYWIVDDPDNLHWFIDFSRDFIPGRKITSQTY